MVGIMIVTHGKFGKAILESAELIVGKQQNVITLGLNHEDSVDVLKDQARKAILELNKENGVLVFVDVFGGSPSNVILKIMQEIKFECISGVNMPMLLETFTYRNTCNSKELADRCVKTGEEGVKALHKIFSTETI